MSRVIPVLLVSQGRLVKTVRYQGGRYLGDPLNTLRMLNETGCDEVMLLDMSAGGHGPDLMRLRRAAGECFMPLCYGGGVRGPGDALACVRAGVDKVAIRTAAVRDPAVLSAIAAAIGRQSTVAVVDVRRDALGHPAAARPDGTLLPVPLAEHLRRLCVAGAGEILVSDVDRDGLRCGYDEALIRLACSAVDVPVIILGGANVVGDLVTGSAAGASACAASSLFFLHGRHAAVLVSGPSPVSPGPGQIEIHGLCAEPGPVTARGRQCVRCVMDESDPQIVFDAEGVCSHCRHWDTVQAVHWLPDERGQKRLEAEVARLRAAGRGRPYDAAIGLSGGVDSAWLAMRLAVSGLRLLAVHVDTGWNTAVAAGNILAVVKGLGIDLDTEVVDWEEMRDLQLAFLRSGVPNQDIPQDHAIFAGVRRLMRRHGVACLLSGHNLATESVLPAAWGYNAMDLRHLRAIHRRFGQRPLRGFPVLPLWRLRLLEPLAGIRVLRPLDWLAYDRATAERELSARFGWRSYGGKHEESRFTTFFQSSWLPRRFGWDKRRAHLSSRILSGQIRRDEALAELEAPPCLPGREIRLARAIARKLDLDYDALQRLMTAPRRAHDDYPSNAWITRLSGRIRGAMRSVANQATR